MDSKNKKPLRISAPKWLFYLVGPPRLELGTNGLWVRTIIHKIDNKYNKLTNNPDAKYNKNKETSPNKNNFLICKKLQVFRLQNSFSKLFLYLM